MRIGLITCVVFGVIALPLILLIAMPAGYPTGAVVHVDSGESVGETALKLNSMHALKSVFMFKALVRVFGANGVHAGLYSLDGGQNAITLGYRFARGVYGLEPVRITIPEGATVADTATLLKASLQDFESKKFIADSRSLEGYLFPDTYFFLPGTPPETVIQSMKKNYEDHVAPLRADIASSTHSEADIIAMASLLQEEARKHETMKVISGILWKRLKLGMPLQVDAVFGYIFKRDTYSPTFEDLSVDSPYNTYTRKGLPPGPIGSPGMDAIVAALHPTATPYLYYLTGKDGVMHYAKTFEAHVANRVYLK